MGQPAAVTEPSARAGEPAPATRRCSLDRAECVVRRVLLVPEGPPAVNEGALYRVFHVSMLLSATRCLLTYVLLPFVLPAVGATAGLGPGVGIPLAVVALFFDVVGLRRFWVAEHRWRWPMTVVYLAVIGLVAALLAGDVARLFG